MQFRPYNLSTWIFFQIGNLIGSFFKRRQLSTQPRTCVQIRHDGNGYHDDDDCPYTDQEYENLMSWEIDPEEHWRRTGDHYPLPMDCLFTGPPYQPLRCLSEVSGRVFITIQTAIGREKSLRGTDVYFGLAKMLFEHNFVHANFAGLIGCIEVAFTKQK